MKNYINCDNYGLSFMNTTKIRTFFDLLYQDTMKLSVLKCLDDFSLVRLSMESGRKQNTDMSDYYLYSEIGSVNIVEGNGIVVADSYSAPFMLCDDVMLCLESDIYTGDGPVKFIARPYFKMKKTKLTNCMRIKFEPVVEYLTWAPAGNRYD